MEAVIDRLRKALPDNLPGKAHDGRITFVDQTCPRAFWGNLLCSLENGKPSALLNPGWPAGWTKELTARATAASDFTKPFLMVPTSGSTGLPKFCIHTIDTLTQAARGFKEALAAEPAPHCVNVLPQHHIGGLMPVFRSANCGGLVHFADYRDAGKIANAPFPLEQASISLVPTQLRRMLDQPILLDLLKRFSLILVGGAACPPALLDQSREIGLRLAPCYGSTETAAMVTLLHPNAFLKGVPGVGKALPHVDIEILKDGRISVQSPALFKGYLPVSRVDHPRYETGDIGKLDPEGNLQILGRVDRVIITGGENVHPELVETTAMNSGLLNSATCKGMEDPLWGSRIELWIDPIEQGADVIHQLTLYLKESLPPFARPKKIHLARE